MAGIVPVEGPMLEVPSTLSYLAYEILGLRQDLLADAAYAAQHPPRGSSKMLARVALLAWKNSTRDYRDPTKPTPFFLEETNLTVDGAVVERAMYARFNPVPHSKYLPYTRLDVFTHAHDTTTGEIEKSRFLRVFMDHSDHTIRAQEGGEQYGTDDQAYFPLFVVQCAREAVQQRLLSRMQRR